MTPRLALVPAAALLAVLVACAGTGPEATPTAAAETQPGVTIERGISFATLNGTPLILDLHVPPDPRGAPIVFGGEDLGLAEAGAIVVLEDLALGDPPDYDEQGGSYLANHGAWVRLEAEVRACMIRFARARAAELGSEDPTVVLSGLSQPGGLAAHVALFGATLEERWEEFAAAVGGPPRQIECLVEDGSTRVDGLVDTAGTYDLYVPVYDGLYGRAYQQAFDPELQRFLASALGAHPELKVRLFHGTGDGAIPVSSSEEFAAALRGAGYDVELTTFEGGHTVPPAGILVPVYKELLGL